MARKNRSRREKKIKAGVDWTFIVVLIFIVAFGLIMIYSAGSYGYTVKNGGSTFEFMKTQLIATLLAFVLMIAAAMVDYHQIIKFSLVLYIACAVFIVATGIIGKTINGASRWLSINNTSLQPAEIAKISVILIVAQILTMVDRKKLNTWKGMLIVLAPGALMALFVGLFNDNLSTAIIILGMTCIMIFVATENYSKFLAVGAVGAAGTGLLIFALEKNLIARDGNGFRLTRVVDWWDLLRGRSQEAFQTLQAMYSIGSGGMFGKGLGRSIQKLGILPEAHNDMIFSVICEELGMFGAAAVILLFLTLLWRCVVIAQNANDMVGALIVVGVIAHISLQVLLNIAVVTGTIPNTGVTLPFISKGGSAVVFTMVEMGMVLNVSKEIVLE